jgi:hypothetical protein
VLSLLVGLRTEEARALRWDHVELDGTPDNSPAVPPHVAVWRSVRARGETKTERSRRSPVGDPANRLAPTNSPSVYGNSDCAPHKPAPPLCSDSPPNYPPPCSPDCSAST